MKYFTMKTAMKGEKGDIINNIVYNVCVGRQKWMINSLNDQCDHFPRYCRLTYVISDVILISTELMTSVNEDHNYCIDGSMSTSIHDVKRALDNSRVNYHISGIRRPGIHRALYPVHRARYVAKSRDKIVRLHNKHYPYVAVQ